MKHIIAHNEKTFGHGLYMKLRGNCEEIAISKATEPDHPNDICTTKQLLE